MIGIGIGILAAFVGVMIISLAKAAGMADRRLEEIRRLAEDREADDGNGN